MIQQHLGEDALSDTCYIYPRSIVQFGERLEQSLTLSCPEAARLALTQADAFAFVSAEFTTRLTTTTVIGSVRGFTMEVMDEVHIFLIQLFQTDALSNTERLVVVGWLCQQLDGLVACNNQTQADSLLAEIRSMVESGSVRAIVSQLSRQQEVSITLFSILFASKTPSGTSAGQVDVFERVRSGLGIDAALDSVKIANNYARGSQLLQTDNSVYNQLMSHYLLNDLVRETFPWTQATAMGHYRRLLTRYGILRLMLAGVAAALNAAPDEATTVQTIQVFCRKYQHSMSFVEQAEGLLAESNWTQLEKLYALLN